VEVSGIVAQCRDRLVGTNNGDSHRGREQTMRTTRGNGGDGDRVCSNSSRRQLLGSLALLPSTAILRGPALRRYKDALYALFVSDLSMPVCCCEDK
jgi:hypothetical protein